jgi:hypothetical protein
MDITLETAYYMEKDIIKYAEGNGYTLASKFKPLDERYMKGANEMKSKKFWLRIYAIHEVSDDTDLYVVSGGGIKLVHQMQDCIFLQKELDKLKITQTYLHSL